MTKRPSGASASGAPSTATSASREPTAVVKRSLTIAGHRTSLKLEVAFWRRLEAQAAARGLSLSALVAEVDAGRGAASLSSALRVFGLPALAGETG